MLTVIREMAHAVSQHLAHMDRQRLSAEAGDTEQDDLLAQVLAVAASSGQEAVERTPEQLDVLAEAGVVDAGAHGLVVILAGIVAGLRGEVDALPEVAHREPPRQTRPHHFDSQFRYCTNFIVTGDGLVRRSFVRRSRRSATRSWWWGRGDPEGAPAHRRARGRGGRLRGGRRRPAPGRRRHARADRGARAPLAAGAHRGRRGGGRRGAEVAVSRRSARTSSTAARLSIPPPTRSLPASTRWPPTRCWCCPTRRTWSWPRGRRRSCPRSRPAWSPRSSQQAALAALVEVDSARDAAANAERLESALAEIRWGAIAPAARAGLAGPLRAR